MANRLLMRVATALVLLAAVQPPAPAQSAWKSYPYPADGFSISAPSQPSITNQTQATGAGKVDLHNYIISLSNTVVVIISSSQVPGLEKASANDRLQKAKAGALAAGNATLTTEKEITLGSYPGLQYEATGQNQLHVRVRTYIVKNRLYQLMEICPVSTPFPPDAERITSSFKLLN